MSNVIEKISDIWENYSTGIAIIAIVGIVIGAFALAFGLACFKAWLVMVPWNWIAVDLFGAPVLSFWVAFCLRWLCALLFKGNVTVKKSEN